MGPTMDDLVSRGQGLVRLWNKSGIQILVLLSFGMQVFLHAGGFLRRRTSSPFLKPILWLVYLLADSTAIYALGHLSVTSGEGSRDRQLVSFWAPFLLLYLGGPDNITAYSLEDNQLWLRHLQILIVQVLAAAYVTYKSMASGSTLLLLLASISMFVVGLAKYGERTWALKRSSTSGMRNSLNTMGNNPNWHLKELLRGTSDEAILFEAHYSLHMCKSIFTHFPFVLPDINSANTRDSSRKHKPVEMQMSLMYDTLYTKAAVAHTWYGFCIRIVSVFGTASAFLLFHLDLTRTSRKGGKNYNGYNGGDVIVSYVLLVGALVLEAISLCKALVSTWTRTLLRGYTHNRKGQGWGWLLRALDFLGERVQPARSRLWQGSIGQYNLFDLCTRDRNKLGSRLTKKMGKNMEDWWNKLHFRGTFTPNDYLWRLVYRVVPALKFSHCDQQRLETLLNNKMGSSRCGKDHDPSSRCGKDFNESVLIWSIVTEKCIHLAKHKQETVEQGKLLEAIEGLSNYMMFLMVVKPEMLPIPQPQNAHADICYAWDEIWEKFSPQEGRNKSRDEQREELLTYVLHPQSYIKYIYQERRETNYDPQMIMDKVLRICDTFVAETEWCDTLEIMLAVWLELLLYAAEHCSPDSHARCLTDNRGEFITILWLMDKQNMFQPASNCSAYEKKPAVIQLGEMDEELLKHYDGSDPNKPLLMAINGNIYDVTKHRVLYGPGGHYSLFAGKRANKAIKDLAADFMISEDEALDLWEERFKRDYTMVGTIKQSVPLHRSPSFHLMRIDEEEPKQYDGSDPDKPLLGGQIYDVSSSRFYCPGGQNSIYAGKDGSRAIANNSFEPEDLTSDISGLGLSKHDILNECEDKFQSEYAIVGTTKKSASHCTGVHASNYEIEKELKIKQGSQT